jgi:hypothetical protein
VVADRVVSQSVDTGGAVINDEYYFASRFDGGDADTRLDNALSAASNGKTIYLESATYGNDRTISTEVDLVGVHGTSGTEIDASWTMQSNVSLRHILFASTASLSLGFLNRLSDCLGTASVTVTSNRVRIWGCDDLSVTFESGTSEGIVDASTRVSVTDNGTNTVGDIA